MSDSFADLWSSTTSKPKPQTLSSASSSSSVNRTTAPNQPYRSASSKPDVFALLAGSSSTGGQNQRYGSPNIISSTPSSRPISAIGGRTSSNGTPPAPSAVASKSGDAFSDLFSGPKGGGNGQAHSGMTLAERLAFEEKERTRGVNSPVHRPPPRQTQGGDAWAGLDALAGGTTKKVKVDDHDDWGLGDFGATTTVKATTTSGTQLQQPARKTTQEAKTLWDLDDFASPTPAPAASSSSTLQPQSISTSRSASRVSQRSTGHVDSPEVDFDFGNREDRPSTQRNSSGSGGRGPTRTRAAGLLDLDDLDDDLAGSRTATKTQRKGLLDSDDEGDAGWGDVPANGGGHGGDEDDILGMLSKPVEVVKAKVGTNGNGRTRQQTTSSTTSQHHNTRSSSPPPHILGQIVEMGFSVAQAREALAQTSDGKDVPAALEMLLNGGGGGGPSEGAAGGYMRDHQPPPRELEQPPAPPRTRGAPKGQKERERERQERMRREREGPDGPAPGPSIAVQEQADKLLSQASEIGLSVLSKASAFWKEGKQKVVQAYEERAANAGSDGPTGPRGVADGRPKWMQDAQSFKDDDEDVDERPRHRQKETQRPAQRAQRQQQPQPQQQHAEEEASIDLFGVDSEPSNSRHRPPPQRQQQRQASIPTPPIQQRKPPTPPPTRMRNLPTASPHSLSTALKHKTAGTDQFKLGQYGPASESYTLAIGALPAGHLLLVPLYTNRALARIRTGEYKAAGEDAGSALVIVVSGDDAAGAGANGVDAFDPNASSDAGSKVNASSWNPSLEQPSLLSSAQRKANDGGWTHPQGVGVDVCDGFVKALRRRAEASEGRERWAEALKDWEVVASRGWVQDSVRKEAASGAARCRKMVDGPGSGSTKAPVPSSAPKPKPKPRPPVAFASSTAPSTALRSLQATTAQAEADDTLKHQLKDSVDARLSAWRTGKETNVRALLASLDMVLWEEILKGGVKVAGMHELVTPGQVKKGYVKAIGRVHPDKLNAQNSTVEQRMLANGVFGTLNEAWIAFQSGK